MERGLTKNEIISIMAMSPHGDLSQYTPVFSKACKSDPEFAAHFISYTAQKSQVRDMGQALPVISLAIPGFDEAEFVGNSLAHLAKLSPRELLRALKYAKFGQYEHHVQVPGQKQPSKRVTKVDAVVAQGIRRAHHVKTVEKLVTKYLRARENNPRWFETTVLNFRRSLADLYFMSHTKPSADAKAILYDKARPVDSVLETVSKLNSMNPREIALAISEQGIPFLTLFPILEKKSHEPVVLSAIIDSMTPTELQTNIKKLEKLGVNDYPETRASLELSLAKLAKASTKTVLKTTRAVEAGGIKDAKLRDKLKGVQEKQLDNMRGVEGDWAVLADKSGSMSTAIETARHIAAVLSRVAKGKVYLVFFDNSPRFIEATGKTYEQLAAETRHVIAQGGTSIGCGLRAVAERKDNVDGIAIISDGGENAAPRFVDVYQSLCGAQGKSIPVYFYHLPGEGDSLSRSMEASGLELQTFDLTRTAVDFYSLPNLVQTMRTNRYSLHDEIMESKLLTVDQVLKMNRKEYAHAG